MSTETTNPVKRDVGRPLVTIDWPNSPFTVQQLQADTKLSKVTLYQKVGEAVASNTISVVGKEKVKQGRPRTIYSKTVAVANAAPATPVPSPAPAAPVTPDAASATV